MDDEKFDIDKYLSEKVPSEEQKSEEAKKDVGAGRGSINPPNVAAVEKAHEEQKKKEDELKAKEIAAGAGAATGAALRYKGVEAGKNILAPGENVFKPTTTAVRNINAKLRQMTGVPSADISNLSEDQVQRILSGGEGPTYGTTGRQRQEGFNLETQRRARNQKEIENLINKIYPNAQDPLANVNEPMVPLRSNILVFQSTANAQAAQEANQQLQNIENAGQAAKTSGVASGVRKLGQGALGGGLTGLQAYNMATQQQPVDWSQAASLAGNLGITFGGNKLGALGALAQIPYAIKHREEIARGMTLGDINPTVFGGAPEALETPINSAMDGR